VVCRRDDAAAANAIASGSQHKTMSAISHPNGLLIIHVIPNTFGDVAYRGRLGLDFPARSSHFNWRAKIESGPDRIIISEPGLQS
jgi:hypothetical protein